MRWYLHTLSQWFLTGIHIKLTPGSTLKPCYPGPHTRLIKSEPVEIGGRTWHQCFLNINISLYKYNITVCILNSFPGDVNVQSGFLITVHLIFNAKSIYLYYSIPI